MIESKDEYKSDKIISADQAIKLIEDLKKDNKTSGLAIGGYDLIHPGHMTHFNSAKRQVDCLIVGITADKFNSKRKGEGRPIYTHDLRAFSVAQLEAVDHVLISDYKTAVELIKLLKPSFYVKGPDYKFKTTPGITSEREAIKSVDGDILYTDDEKLSTSKIIDYIKSEVK